MRTAMSFRTEEFSAYLCTQLIFSNIYTSIVCGVFSTRISYRGQFLLDELIRRLFIAELSPFRCNQPKEPVAVTSLFSPRDGTWQSKDSCITVSLSVIGLRLQTTAKPFLFSGPF
ncbi:hypothetical protein D5086_021196 [Populus alba]|uniref:Uncharacterized protein n=1 Tax=Populus alba TaxID=43335 RepID=A0ACC4BD86_POPAL